MKYDTIIIKVYLLIENVFRTLSLDLFSVRCCPFLFPGSSLSLRSALQRCRRQQLRCLRPPEELDCEPMVDLIEHLKQCTSLEASKWLKKLENHENPMKNRENPEELGPISLEDCSLEACRTDSQSLPGLADALSGLRSLERCSPQWKNDPKVMKNERKIEETAENAIDFHDFKAIFRCI